MSKKFKLREDLSIYFFGHKLFRIECVEGEKMKFEQALKAMREGKYASLNGRDFRNE